MTTNERGVVRDLAAKCETCTNTWGWHVDNDPKHPFNDGSIPVSTTFGKRKDRREKESHAPTQGTPETMPWPFDPVLRQALIDKGVLTPQDLVFAENKIKMVFGSQVEELKNKED